MKTEGFAAIAIYKNEKEAGESFKLFVFPSKGRTSFLSALERAGEMAVNSNAAKSMVFSLEKGKAFIQATVYGQSESYVGVSAPSEYAKIIVAAVEKTENEQNGYEVKV